MKTAAIVVLLLAGLAAASIPLGGEELYCERYAISELCRGEPPGEPTELEPFVNELVFLDSLRYDGPLEILEISVEADAYFEAEVVATYRIINTGPDVITVKFNALDAPEGTELYEDGELMDVDAQLDGWESTFGPGQEKTIRLEFTEPLYGDIFGYNINLVINGSIPDNHITPVGSFEFSLPLDSVVRECSPEGYTTKIVDYRPVVTWEKRDFVPWTNPLDDLICTWEIETGTPADQGGGLVSGEPVQEPDNIWMVAILVFVLLAGVIYWYARVKR